LLVTASVPFIAGLKGRVVNEKKELARFWEADDYGRAFQLSKTALAARPMNYFLLTIHGFAAYQLGISQINAADTIGFIDECIWSLRKALLLKNAADDGRVYYVLGKAYACKGDNYADMAVKYLEQAQSLSYSAADIPEYLGLAYAAIGDFRSSVEAFSRALEPAGQSDALLLSIARSYLALDEFEAAQAYLSRCIAVSPDSQTVLTARLLLAEIMLLLDDAGGAETQYLSILNDAGENAEARYQLGEIYALRGDTTRARSQWRLAYKADPAHAKTRARLNI
jgi:tetratricopeptide (TPR) repeat protein